MLCFSLDFDPGLNILLEQFLMEAFEKLPSEILVVIVKSAPDLATLHSLRLASPACAALLADQNTGYSIVETVATASLAKDNQIIFGYIWELLQRPEHTWSKAPDPTDRNARFCIASRFVASLPTAESTLRLLALAKVVHGAAHRCLHTLLQRFTALRPKRPSPEHPNFNLRRQRFWKYSRDRPFQLPIEPPSEPVDINLEEAAAPLKWVEEQRALYGAWQLALFAVVREKPVADAWPPSEAQLGHLDAVKHAAPWGLNELPQTLLDKDGTSSSPSQPQRLSDVFPLAPACDEMCCLVKQSDPGGLQFSYPPRALFSYALICPWSLLKAASFGPFRVLGFTIWEERRFVAMGLLYNHDSDIVQSQFSGRGRLAELSDMYAWKSVLIPAQLEALEAAQYAEWEQCQQRMAALPS